MSEGTSEITLPKSFDIEDLLDAEERFRYTIGLDIASFQGKSVLDVGAGSRSLEKLVKKKGIESSIVSYDIKDKALLKGGKPDKGVIGSLYDGLPFRDKSFDEIVSVGGPLKGGPWSEDALFGYKEALRVLTDDGEIRISAPFDIEGGVTTLFYYAAKDKEFLIDNNDVEEDYAADLIDKFDDDGLPEEESAFWLRYYVQLTRDNQVELQQYIADELERTLQERGDPVELSLVDRDPASKVYTPYLLMRKRKETTLSI